MFVRSNLPRSSISDRDLQLEGHQGKYSNKMRSPVLAILVAACVVTQFSDGADAWLFSRSSSSSSGSRSHDVTSGSQLTRLYNTPVVRAETVQRPLGSGNTMSPGPLRHSGTLIETSEGDRLLVHKGPDYGDASETVVVDAGHMSNRWQPVEGSQHPVRNANVGDFVAAGGEEYGLLTDNCHDAADRMSQVGNNE